jgi:hypothetical protein
LTADEDDAIPEYLSPESEPRDTVPSFYVESPVVPQYHSPVRVRRSHPMLDLSFCGGVPITVTLLDATPSNPALTEYLDEKHLISIFPSREIVTLEEPPTLFEIECEGGPFARIEAEDEAFDVKVLPRFSAKVR